MEIKILFEYGYSESEPNHYFWYFGLCGGKVIWDFHVISSTFRWTHEAGYAEFDKTEFKKLLEEYFEKNWAILHAKNAYGCDMSIELRKEYNNTVYVTIDPGGWEKPFSLGSFYVITPDILKLFE